MSMIVDIAPLLDVLTHTRIYKPRSAKPPSGAPEDSWQTTMF